MAVMGEGQLSKEGASRLLEHQKDEGDSPMDVDGTLCTAPPDPLSDGDDVLELLQLYAGGAIVGSQSTQLSGAGQRMSDPGGDWTSPLRRQVDVTFRARPDGMQLYPSPGRK